MQYLLTEEEMGEARRLRILERDLPGGSIKEHLRVLTLSCQQIAAGMTPEGDTATAHGCIHVKHPDGPGYQARYCDHCPVSAICPQPKEWSK